jgi:hypothetical protein
MAQAQALASEPAPASSSGVRDVLQDHRRRELISGGRDMAHEFTNSGDKSGFRAFLERQRAYPDLKPHLSNGFLKKLHTPRTIYVAAQEAAYPVLVASFLKELERLERKWEL